MKMKHREFTFNVKAVKESGEFEGYASVYDVVDSYKEVVAPGAFKRTLEEWKAKDALPPALWQHRSGEPLGPFLEMREDDRGLWVRGQLLVDDIPRAREARALMQARAVRGMSIGFNVYKETWDSDSKLLYLNEIDLWEVSIVTFPANVQAKVEAVKNMFADKLPDLKEFEDFLREAGFSRSQAKVVANRGLSALMREAESNGGDNTESVDVKSILAEVFKSK